LGRNSEKQNWGNVFNGGATTSGRMAKQRPQLDSACRIGLRSHPPESSDYSVDVSTGGEICWAEFRKSEKQENVFNGRATTSGHIDKQRPQLDSARRIDLGSTPHRSSDCSVDV